MKKLLGALLVWTLMTTAASQDRLEDWYVVDVIDPITDEEDTFVYTPATEYPDGAIPGDTALMAACLQDGSLRYALSAGLRVGGGGLAEVTVRVDRDAAVAHIWS